MADRASPRTLIIGGTKGVGRATARLLAARGHRLALAYSSDSDAAREVLAELGSGAGGAPTASAGAAGRTSVTSGDAASGPSATSDVAAEAAVLIRGDVATEAADIVGQAAETLGGLDNVIVTAVPVITGRLSDMTDADAQRAYDVNVTGFRHAVLAARPHLAERGGSAIAVSSLGAHRYASYYGALGPAKAALEALVQYLAAELGRHGIRVNAVSPCLIDDPVHLASAPELRPFVDAVAARTPLRRTLVTPDDVAGVIGGLVSSDFAVVTGQTLVVDGGYSLQA